MQRNKLLDLTEDSEFDVTVIGGGISGARIYSELCSRGYKVLLIDKGDFGCGTSQASGMMVWGGLLYLKNLDFKTVYKLCKARDEMISHLPDMVDSCSFRYMPGKCGGRNRLFVYWAMVLYWLIGSKDRSFPRGEKEYSELKLINQDNYKKSLIYEEAFLNLSDCRFVLLWLMAWQSERTVPLNYCSVNSSSFKNSRWHLSLKDKFGGRELECTSRFIVNAAGVWTDSVNYNFDVESLYRHHFSKGVYINLPRPEEHKTALIFDMGRSGDTQSYAPWGPVSMWGPTENTVEHLQGSFKAEQEDLNFLINMANKNLKQKVDISDIVSVRAGVRPLAVERGFSKKVYPLDLSRKHMINQFSPKNFLSIYGGKLTSGGIIAEEVASLLKGHLKSGENKALYQEPDSYLKFPGINLSIPSPQWCRDNEACHTLEDYLRRRTNISQWVSNEGFGADWENEKEIREIADVFDLKGTQFQERLSTVKNSILNKLQEK